MRTRVRAATIGSVNLAGMTLIAVASLLLTAVLLLVPGGVLFAPLLLGLALLALIAVLGGLGDRSVRQHNPPMNPKRWRDGS
jgi:hypothetical protein